MSSSEETSSSEEKPWRYCDAPVSLCLNMNDPARANLDPDPLVFDTGNNASYAVSDTPKWPEVTWLDLKGKDPVRSDKEVEITTIKGQDDDQLGMDVWVRHDAAARDEIMVALHEMIAIGRGKDGKIRCAALSDKVFADPFKSTAWRSTSFPVQNAGEWQHVACFTKGTRWGIWYLGKTNEENDATAQHDHITVNVKSKAKIILGRSDWMQAKFFVNYPTSSADIAGIRMWNNIDTMLKVLNEEHQAALNP